MTTVAAEDSAHPHVYLFGGGHVGHALAAALSLLPLRVTIVETRADALEGMPETVEARLTPVPEEVVRTAPAGSAFVGPEPGSRSASVTLATVPLTP